MFVLSPFIIPFVWLFKILAEFFRNVSNGFYWLYNLMLGWSIWLNDIAETSIWPKD